MKFEMGKNVRALILALAFIAVLSSTGDSFKPLSAVASSGGSIDLFSQKGGRGIDQPDGVFQPQEQIRLYTLVTYNGEPVVSKLVSFEVHGPENPYYNIIFVQTAFTNASGIAEISFLIPLPVENPWTIVLGVWNSWATAEVAEQTLKDSLTFLVIFLGDVDCDGNVEISDLVLLARAYKSKPGDPNWNQMADMNFDGTISLTDLTVLATHYGEHYP
jgi:hypothetical protein